MAKAVAEHDRMVLFGVIDGYAHDFRIIPGLLKQPKKFLTSILVNVALFHGEAPPFDLFQLLSCRLNPRQCHWYDTGWLRKWGVSP